MKLTRIRFLLRAQARECSQHTHHARAIGLTDLAAAVAGPANPHVIPPLCDSQEGHDCCCEIERVAAPGWGVVWVGTGEGMLSALPTRLLATDADVRKREEG